MTLRLGIELDTATPAMRQALAGLQDKQGLLMAMGRGVVNHTSRHVRAWGGAHPNKLGGRRTNYWSRIARRITPEDCLEPVGTEAVAMVLGDGMPGIMRAFGPVTIVAGTKTPGVKFLTLPARSESYGMRAREFKNLMPFWGRGGPKGLAEAVAVERKRDSKKGAKGTPRYVPGLVMYWFRHSVTQPQDRTLLPSEADWSETANQAAGRWVRQQLRTGPQGGASV